MNLQVLGNPDYRVYVYRITSGRKVSNPTVRVKHVATGTSASCSTYKSQHKNLQVASEQLRELLQ